MKTVAYIVKYLTYMAFHVRHKEVVNRLQDKLNKEQNAKIIGIGIKSVLNPY